MSQHTPTITPWQANESTASWLIETDEVFIASVGSSGLTDEENAANAAFIVRACNSHATLVKALEDMRRLAASLEDMLKDGQPMDPDTQVLADSQHADASAALKLAKN